MKKDRLQTYLLILIAIVTVCLIAVYENINLTEVNNITLDTEEVTASNRTINLNTATVEDLTQIEGIGEVLATRIVEYRDSIGGFLLFEQLLEIEGIGDSKFEAILNACYLEPF